MNYLIYDVETPNRHNDAICACAWILHDGTKELSSGYSLIDPHTYFDKMNTSIHGIGPDDVAGAPTFAEYWTSTLAEVFCSSVILAHSALFDLSATSKALAAAGIELPRVRYIDTLTVFRGLMPGESCKLPDIAARYCVKYHAHHAGEDVRALCTVLDLLRDGSGYQDYAAMFDAAQVAAAQASSEAEKLLQRSAEAAAAALLEAARAHQVNLQDNSFAFHGEMRCLPVSRDPGLSGIITALGGTFQAGVSGKTDFFVSFDDHVTGTVKKAMGIAEKPGSTLRIIDESAFLDMLGYRTAQADHESPRTVRIRKQAERAAAIAQAEEKEKRAELKARAAAEKKNAADEEKQPRKPGRAVIQLTKDGQVVQTFETVSMAAASLGVSTKVIRDCAAGVQKSAAGFVWRYADE